MQNDGELENSIFRGPFLIKKRSFIEHIIRNNHKNRSQPKYFNKKLINATHLLIRIQFLAIDKKITQSVLKKPMTIPNICKIPMMTLISLVHKT